MKKRSGIAPLIAIGGILLALSVGSFFLTPDRAFSENENRYLQLTPRLTWDRVMSGDFMEDVEDYTSDQIVFRDFWTAARSVLQRAEGKEDISGTYLGADGRYFAKVTDDSFDWVRLEKNAGYIRDFFAASGKPCTALIVPSPAGILRDMLPENAPYFNEDKAFGQSGARVVIEEFMEGPEVSVLSFTDGETVVPMVSSMDHKCALDGDKGPNTGGMGTIAPNPCYTKKIAAECMETIFLPTIRAMKAEGRPFKGCLYFGLMLTKNGPKVVEYNCRFGDPETQVVLPLLSSDLLSVMQATTNGTLKDVNVAFSSDSACCVVLASEGYPKKYESGFPITMSEEAAAHTYVAGAKKDGNALLTAGGRVLGVTAVAPTLEEAVKEAYRLSGEVDFANKYCRSDIGRKALAAQKERE